MTQNNPDRAPGQGTGRNPNMPAGQGAGRNAKKPAKISVGRVLLGILTGLMLFVAIGLFFFSMNEIRERSSSSLYLPREESIYWNITEEKYDSALDNVRTLEAADAKLSEQTMECRAVARYYEAAKLHRAYLETGNAEQAAVQEARMKQFAAEAGSMKEHIKTIDERVQAWKK